MGAELGQQGTRLENPTLSDLSSFQPQEVIFSLQMVKEAKRLAHTKKGVAFRAMLGECEFQLPALCSDQCALSFKPHTDITDT